MLKDVKRLLLFIVPAALLVAVCFSLWTGPSSMTDADAAPHRLSDWYKKKKPPSSPTSTSTPSSTTSTSKSSSKQSSPSADQELLQAPSSDSSSAAPSIDIFRDPGLGPYHEIFSATAPDGKYWPITFGEHVAINPNMIPHPTLADTWIAVAQLFEPAKDSVFHQELVCNAKFANGRLACLKPPRTLPIAATVGDKCTGEIDYMANNVGPHDARIFYGPKVPYAMYGSNSQYTCFGQWMQDLRMLVDWGYEDQPLGLDFRLGTELQRPEPYHPLEKNWFVFWDANDQAFAHYQIHPGRSFAKLAGDGSVGPDLAPLVADRDNACLAKYLPELPPPVKEDFESIHQATNSLAITLCRRSDKSCKPDDDNTFVFAIMHHKKYYDWHSTYEPYVVMFRRREPFELYAVSRKPLWIHGRAAFNDVQSEMFFITSMSWKTRGQKYLGYLDDVILLAFGIEDRETAGMDVLASELLMGMGQCSDA